MDDDGAWHERVAQWWRRVHLSGGLSELSEPFEPVRRANVSAVSGALPDAKDTLRRAPASRPTVKLAPEIVQRHVSVVHDRWPLRPPTWMPIVMAASPVAPGDNEPFSWATGGVPKVPVIPTLLWHVPRPVKPMMDLNNSMDNCLVRGVVSFFAGGALGFAMGIFIGSWQLGGPSVETPAGLDPTKMTAREALREMYTTIRTKSISWMKNFAIVGGVFSIIDCTMAKFRGRHDAKNSMASGCLTGAVLAYNQGPVAIFLGCLGFAAFGIVMDGLMHSGPGPSAMERMLVGPEDQDPMKPPVPDERS
jgi:mitochondrial import inner membrane translocase subunit TIM22